jgi:hypothetical protein
MQREICSCVAPCLDVAPILIKLFLVRVPQSTFRIIFGTNVLVFYIPQSAFCTPNFIWRYPLKILVAFFFRFGNIISSSKSY